MARAPIRFLDRLAEKGTYWWAILGPGGVLTGLMSWLAHTIAPIASYGWGAVILSGVVTASFLLLSSSAFLVAWRRFRPLGSASTAKPSYTKTRIRLRNVGGYRFDSDESGTENIFSWRQTYSRVGGDGAGTKPMFHSDTFFFIFKEETDYASPKVDSFGNSFPEHNFWTMGKKGAILQVIGDIRANTFEVVFPEPKRSQCTMSGRKQKTSS